MDLDKEIHRWSSDTRDEVDFRSIHNYINYLAERLFDEYEPTKRADKLPFRARLHKWLSSAQDEADRKIMFQLVPMLYFVGSKEFDSLYQAAFNEHIACWLMDQEGICLDDLNAQERLRKARDETWFCGITDSMQIAKFYHINNIEGVDLRPDWRTLAVLGDKKRLMVT